MVDFLPGNMAWFLTYFPVRNFSEQLWEKCKLQAWLFDDQHPKLDYTVFILNVGMCLFGFYNIVSQTLFYLARVTADTHILARIFTIFSVEPYQFAPAAGY